MLHPMEEPRSVAIPGARLAVAERGRGEPVLLIQTALTADELFPLADAMTGFRRIVPHRRGYGDSSPASGPGSIPRDAADAAALLAVLDVDRAHVVGFSYAGAVAMQLAADRPDLVHSLVLLEPPPTHTPSTTDFRAANDRLLTQRHEDGPQAALDEFFAQAIGPDWQEATERLLPGSAAQMERDVHTFFDVDIPALLAWEFGPGDAAQITCPVLHVGASDSGQWFAEVADLVAAWLPHAEQVVVDGADHGFPLTHVDAVAGAVTNFLQRHPIPHAA